MLYDENDMLDNFMMHLQSRQIEERLNEMWANYGKGVPYQLKAYNQQVESVKKIGGKVLRNSKGKHKIVWEGKK